MTGNALIAKRSWHIGDAHGKSRKCHKHRWLRPIFLHEDRRILVPIPEFPVCTKLNVTNYFTACLCCLIFFSPISDTFGKFTVQRAFPPDSSVLYCCITQTRARYKSIRKIPSACMCNALKVEQKRQVKRKITARSASRTLLCVNAYDKLSV